MIQPRLHKQLFLDDEAIETKHGLRRTLNKPERAGPVMRPDRSLGQVSLGTGGPPQWNPDLRAWELVPVRLPRSRLPGPGREDVV